MFGPFGHSKPSPWWLAGRLFHHHPPDFAPCHQRERVCGAGNFAGGGHGVRRGAAVEGDQRLSKRQGCGGDCAGFVLHPSGLGGDEGE